MSQVIATSDKLSSLRNKSKLEEDQIDRNSMFEPWKKNDISKTTAIEKLLILAIMGIFSIWSLLVALGALSLGGLAICFKAFGEIFQKFTQK